MSYWGGNFPEPAGGGGGSGDTTPPTITLMSPSAPGGFPADFSAARDTPIVLRVTDAVPGIEYLSIVATFPGGTEMVVYRRGVFRGKFAGLSTSAVITNGIELSIRYADGWPPGSITFEADAIDGDGNLAS